MRATGRSRVSSTGSPGSRGACAGRRRRPDLDRGDRGVAGGVSGFLPEHFVTPLTPCRNLREAPAAESCRDCGTSRGEGGASLMWIVRLALRRPYTFVVMGLAILLLGFSAIVTTPTDIFPEIDIPVVSVIWNYDGLTTEDMASRITTFSEYTISSAVSDVRSIESQTYPGVGVIKIYFQPNVNVEAALAQVTAVSQTILRRMPPGAVPPFILQYNASSVPIIQLALSGRAIPEAQLYDYGIYRIRQQVAPIQGITLPLPYGGKPRQIMVDLDPQALLSKGISAADVSNAVNLQNLTLPSGTVKLGPQEYRVSLNSSPDAVAALNDLPVKYVNGAVVYVRDVGHVRDGFAVQTNIVRQDGGRSALLTVIKKGGASCLTVVKQLKELLPALRDHRRAGGGRDRGIPDRAHDPALPRELAQHARRHHVHPAVDPHLARDPQRDRPDAQRDDPRRSRAGRRHPRRRRHGGDREHPPQPRARHAARPGDSGRRAADRHAGVRLDALDLHRVRAGGVPHRTREVSVHAAGHGRRVRDARLVPALAHDRADARALSSGGRDARRGRHGGRVLRPHPRRVPAAVRAPARHVRTRARARAGPARAGAGRLRGRGRERAGAAAVRRMRLLPHGGHGPVPPARPRAGRDAHRRNGAGLRRSRGRDPAHHPEERDR